MTTYSKKFQTEIKENLHVFSQEINDFISYEIQNKRVVEIFSEIKGNNIEVTVIFSEKGDTYESSLKAYKVPQVKIIAMENNSKPQNLYIKYLKPIGKMEFSLFEKVIFKIFGYAPLKVFIYEGKIK